jgi:dynein heavy chain
MFGCSKYVETELGKLYSESPIATMDSLFADSDKKTPIIFVLSSGADPTQQVIQFAHKMDFYERLQYKSLGQG